MSIRRLQEIALAFILVVLFMLVAVEQSKWAMDFLATLPAARMNQLCDLTGGCGDR